MKPRIIALPKSPLAEGNTTKLLNKAIFGAEAAGAGARMINVPDPELSSCRECYFCVYWLVI